MSEEDLVRGVVMGHGEFAQGLVDAVRRITGAPEDALWTVSNSGLSPAVLERKLEALTGSGRCIVFTDMPVGSCAVTAQRLSRGRGELAVVMGANLPMLLDFVVNRSLPLEELVDRIVERGRQSIRTLRPAR
jgi:mannose PTS system EIIA component